MIYVFCSIAIVVLLVGYAFYRRWKFKKMPNELIDKTAIDTPASNTPDDFICIMFKDGSTRTINNGVTIHGKRLKR